MINANHKEIILSCGSKIQIFDNLFSWQEREYFFQFVAGSLYTTQNGASTATTESFSKQVIFQSHYDKNDDKNFNLLYSPNITSHLKTLGFPTRSWANVTLPGCWIHQHSDASTRQYDGQITLMYFASFKWEKHFGGDTIFCNSHTGEKERVVEYVPGRLVLFDSCIPHITTLTIGQALPRYTYVYIFAKEQDEQ